MGWGQQGEGHVGTMGFLLIWENRSRESTHLRHTHTLCVHTHVPPSTALYSALQPCLLVTPCPMWSSLRLG